jgi:hypothetical protein
MFVPMTSIEYIATTLSGIEIASLATVAIGVLALVAVRLLGGGSDPITRRPYGKRYSGAPGANTENRPDVTL